MPTPINWVNGINSYADTVNGVLGQVGEAAISGVCFVRNKYPNALTRGGVLQPVLDRLCTDNGHPASVSPVSVFAGGQSPGVAYYVYACTKADVYTIGSSGQEGAKNATIHPSVNYNYNQLIGPITEVSFFSSGGCPDPRFVNGRVCDYGQFNLSIRIVASNGTFTREMINYKTACFQGPIGEYSNTSYVNYNSLELVDVYAYRVDGQPDTGGDRVSLPPDPPLDPSDFSDTVQICGTPNDAEDQRCVDVQIDFDPFLDENGNQCFTMDGAKYCFTPDGVEKQDEPADQEEPTSPDELEPTTEEDAEESSEEDENIVYVTTEITTLPFSGKSVFHTGAGNNDYFAGYFNWTTSTSTGIYKHPSIPIRKQLQIYVKPEEATGYTTYTVNGAKIKVIKYKKPTEGE